MRYDDALLPRRTNGACGLSRRIQKKPDGRALPIIHRRFEGRDERQNPILQSGPFSLSVTTPDRRTTDKFLSLK